MFEFTRELVPRLNTVGFSSSTLLLYYAFLTVPKMEKIGYGTKFIHQLLGFLEMRSHSFYYRETFDDKTPLKHKKGQFVGNCALREQRTIILLKTLLLYNDVSVRQKGKLFVFCLKNVIIPEKKRILSE